MDFTRPSSNVSKMKYAGLSGAGHVGRERELPFQAHHAERDVLLFVSPEVHADLLAAALRFGDEVQPTVVADEGTDAIPIARVEQARVPIQLGPRRRRNLGLVILLLQQFSPSADQRRLHGHDRGPHRFGRLLEGVPQHVLQDDRAPLRHRERQEAQQRRSNDRRIGFVLESRDLFDLCGARRCTSCRGSSRNPSPRCARCGKAKDAAAARPGKDSRRRTLLPACLGRCLPLR